MKKKEKNKRKKTKVVSNINEIMQQNDLSFGEKKFMKDLDFLLRNGLEKIKF